MARVLHDGVVAAPVNWQARDRRRANDAAGDEWRNAARPVGTVVVVVLDDRSFASTTARLPYRGRDGRWMIVVDGYTSSVPLEQVRAL